MAEPRRRNGGGARNGRLELRAPASADLLLGLNVDERFSRAGSTVLTDALGSTVGLASGASIQTQYGYDPYGVAQTTGVASTNPYQFTGRENDQTAAGLMYYRARYYNPAWGRFVSEDPIGIAGGTNLYGYANQNPVNFGDPSGHFAFLLPFIEACLVDPICRAPLIFGSAILARDIAAGIPNIWIWCSEAKNSPDQELRNYELRELRNYAELRNYGGITELR